MATIRRMQVNKDNPLSTVGDYLIGPGYECLDIMIDNLESGLNLGIVHFAYHTPARATIEAFGTIHPDWYQSGAFEEDVDRNNNPDNFDYYDLGRCKWLTFNRKHLIAIF